MTESAEPSGRFVFSEDDPRLQSDDEEKEKSSGNKGKSSGFPKRFRFWGKRSDSDQENKFSELQALGTRRYDYMVLHRASEGFSDTCLIGRGSSGYVYRGMLNGQQAVAIKVLSKVHSHADDLYMTEIKVLSEMRHRNVVQLLGWCHQAGHLALVFEFVPNHSLYDHLHRSSLPWKVRYWQIAVGLASALLYLQEGLDRCVVHRDIKTSNILLDSDFNPKLVDFGLAKVAPHFHAEAEFSTLVQGTPGYLDPEYMVMGRLTKASDIYAFGVVVLEIASGRRAFCFDKEELLTLPKWVDYLHKKGKILEAVDPNLGDEFDEREVERLLLVGLWCTQLVAKSRPSIKLILQLLNFEVPMPTDFLSNVYTTLPENETRSPPDRTQEEPELFPPGVDIDGTTTFKDMEVDDLMGDSIQDNFEEDGLMPSSSPEHAMFDIGIPPDFGSEKIENYRTDHHFNVLKVFVHSLHEMMQSEENLPCFEDALAKIKIFTAALVATVGPLLNDWNTLAQLVLRYLKEREDFFKFYADHTSVVDDVTVLSLKEGMLKCSRTINEDKGKLKDSKQRRAAAQRKCTSLEAELAEARGILFSIEEEINAAEGRITENLSSLEQRRRQYAILKQYDYVLSEISSFTC